MSIYYHTLNCINTEAESQVFMSLKNALILPMENNVVAHLCTTKTVVAHLCTTKTVVAHL